MKLNSQARKEKKVKYKLKVKEKQNHYLENNSCTNNVIIHFISKKDTNKDKTLQKSDGKKVEIN